MDDAMKTTLNLVTAVSREYNLPRLLRSIEVSMKGSGLNVKWILVFDWPGEKREITRTLLREPSPVLIQRVVYAGSTNRCAVLQKNLGMNHIDPGYYLCLDDDNVLHPEYLKTLTGLIAAHPSKRAFVVAQKRWDKHGTLHADPAEVKPCHIDSAMFTVHTDIIGTDRYDVSTASAEDGDFARRMYAKNPKAWYFHDHIASYFNYLRVDPRCP